MRTSKGLGSMAWVAIVAVGLIFAAGVGYTIKQPQEKAAVVQQAQGEFETFQPLQELSGTDLTLAEQSLNATGIVNDANVVTSFDINGTNGQDHLFAAGFEVDGGAINNVDVEITSAIGSKNLELRAAYLVRDTKTNTLDVDSAAYTLNVEDSQSVDQTISSLPSGEWVLALKTKAISTGSIAAGENLYHVNLEGETEAENSELHYTIDNQ